MAIPVQTPLVKGARGSASTIMLKILMAVTGILFILFVLAHMYGNLKAFAGHDSFNEYAAHLREIGTPMLPRAGFLWVMRVVLIGSLVLHVGCAVVLMGRARAARTTAYVMKRNRSSSLSSRTMRWGGAAILLFVVWHLLNFTIGRVNVTGGPTNDPYNLLVDSFSTWWMTVIYLIAMLALGMHLHHGTWSSAQTLGLTSSTRKRAFWKGAGWVVAVVISGGFSLVPLFTLLGVISK